MDADAAQLRLDTQSFSTRRVIYLFQSFVRIVVRAAIHVACPVCR
jgi:hypothetical protein